ncbi:hypothetical protein NRA10_19130 [Acinetobacter baumannii]|nr:hypothetical protein [Acinetobacter baumannii]
MDQTVATQFAASKLQQTASVILNEMQYLAKLTNAQLSDFIITSETALLLYGIEKYSSHISVILEEQFFNHILHLIREKKISNYEDWNVEANSHDETDLVLTYRNHIHDFRLWKKRSTNLLRYESLIFPNGLYVHPLTLIAEELFLRNDTPVKGNQLRALLKGSTGFNQENLKNIIKDTFSELNIDSTQVVLDEEITKVFLGIKSEVGHIDVFLGIDEFLKLSYHPSIYRDDINAVLVYGYVNFKRLEHDPKRNVLNLEGYKVLLPKFNTY